MDVSLRRRRRLIDNNNSTASRAVLLCGAVLLCAESCSGFAWPTSPYTASVRQGIRTGGGRQSTAVVATTAPRGRLFAVAADGGGSSAVATEGVRRKVVKPWLTKAQETVDYSNVEAM